jgi:hypothetical protein
MPNPNLLTVNVVVATMPVPVTVNRNQRVHELIKEALRVAEKKHEDVSTWFLRSDAREYRADEKIGEAGIVDGMTLFLTKDAGGGG